jgi:DNA replication protein DnaC
MTPQKSGEILLELIMRRYENRSTMASNRPIEEWGKLLSDVPAACGPRLQPFREARTSKCV